ncbi:MAG: bacillithiol biosynthesis cysteine-adding enzyme BshC [Bacteroidia bacterium]
MPFDSVSFPPSTKWFDKLVVDYLNQSPDIRALYAYYPHKNGFDKILEDIQTKTFDRKVLANVLKHQAKSVDNTTSQTFENIQSLLRDNTYTITTGHQLSLFTGPLYFIYKISSAINLSEQLKKLYPAYHFVPVFWMASEDHDIDEINHFYFKDKKFQWNVSTDGTTAGLLNTASLAGVLEEMKQSGLFSDESMQLFADAYLKHSTYAAATRYLVNELFGDKGIVVIDPMHKSLKEKFSDVFHKDIFENALYQSVQNNIRVLSDNHYHVQAKPREINTFLIHDNKRYLIIRDNENFRLKNSDIVFSAKAMENLLQMHPENFSPNVLLRTLFQQRILPNIAYIGGSAEVSYWLPLKPVFDAKNILYPLIIQRPVIFLSTESIERKMNKYHLDYQDIFEADIHSLIYRVLEKQNITVQLDESKTKIQNVFSEVLVKTQNIDATLIPFVNAELTKTLKALETLEHKLNKSIKQKNEIVTKHIHDIYNHYFPQNMMQDRLWNITFAAQIMNMNDLRDFVNEILPHCGIDLNQSKPMIVIKPSKI